MSAVCLDAMGTLVALERPWPLLAAELAARGVAADERQAEAAMRDEIAYYLEHHDQAVDATALGDLRDRCAEALRDGLRRAGVQEVGTVPHADLRAALLAALRFRPFAEVPAALARLRAAGHALVVVSNWDVSLHEMLDSTGLRALVDGAMSSAEAGAAKPDPAIFARALALVGAAPEHAIHVGDSVERDVEGARAAGLRPVLLAREGADREAPAGVVVVGSLDELCGPTALGP